MGTQGVLWRWSGCFRSCSSCCPSCNKEEPLMNSGVHQTTGHAEELEPINDSHDTLGHAEEPIGEAPLNIDTQVRQFISKEQQLPPLSLDELDTLLTLITAQVKSLAPSGSATDTTTLLMHNAVSQYAERKEVVTSFIQSLPTELIKKVVGGGKEVLMPLLTNALGGMGNLQWVGLGLRLIGWTLDNMHSMTQNSEECLEILKDVMDLMEKTKKIWVQASRDHENTTNEDLQKTIQIAFRCAIICTTNMRNHNILRFIDAQCVKGAIAELKQDLRDAKFNNLLYMVTHQYCDVPKVDRQVSFIDDYCNDRVGADEGTREAMEYLIKDCSNDVIALCLHGMGGVGKSFIGMEIFKKFQKSKRLRQESGPYNNCRVELELGIRDEKLVDIQKQILRKLCGLEKSNIFDCIEGREELTKEIKKINGPVFLYLDNVSEPHHLEKILPKASSFPKGSKLLVTSRVGENIQSAIIRSVGIEDCKLIEIKMMQDDQAKKLLWKQIISGPGEEKQVELVSKSVALEELEKKVLKLCGGLPLALKVVGGYIGNAKQGATADTLRVWQTVVDAMEKAEPLKGEAHDELYSRIKFSTENLDPNLQRSFLDIVSYYDIGSEWKSIERLVNPNHLDILHQRALVQKTLKSSSSEEIASLLEIHDVLIALARRMINADTQELRITGMDNFKQHNQGNLEKVVALKGVSLQACMLMQMPRLRFMKDVYVEGEAVEEAQLRHLSVVHKLRSRTGKLFNLNECEGLKEVYWSGAVENASHLELLRHKNISKELQVLRLEKWKQLKNVDVVETLRCLKELALRECTEISYLPEGINSLTNLEKLHLCGCRNLKSLPNGVTSLTALTTLDLSFCSSLQMLPDGMGSLTAMTTLNLSWCSSLQMLPEGMGSLTAMTTLDLSWCSSLQMLAEGMGSLTALTTLHLGGCSSLQMLPEGMGSLTALTTLQLYGCSSLQMLPEGMGSLTALTTLHLGGCSIQCLPEGIGRLKSLTVLNLEICQSLQCLPEGISGLKSLSKLDLKFCTGLKCLPEEVGGLKSLTELDLSGCDSSLLMQPVLQMLPRLTHLNLCYCRTLKSIEAVTALTSLTEINLFRCESLQMLPEGFSRLTRLTRLDLRETSSLNSLQEIKSFDTGRLKWLAVGNCEGLYSLMEEGAFSTLGMLTHVELSGRRCLQYLPESITSLTSLERLSFEGHGSLQFLPDELTSLTGLKHLTLTKWESVQSLPQGITSLVHLEDFEWKECRSLKALPRGVAQYWTCLTTLHLQECSSLQSLQEIAGLTGLRQLSLEGCASLEPSCMLEDIFWNLTDLRRLELLKWDSIQALPECALARLTRLDRLNLSGCRSLVCVPEEVTRLTSLCSLDLSGCKSLKCLPQGLSTLANPHLTLSDYTSLLEKDTSLEEEEEDLWSCEATRLSHYPNLFQAES